jgi:hypothetical protein
MRSGAARVNVPSATGTINPGLPVIHELAIAVPLIVARTHIAIVVVSQLNLYNTHGRKLQ